MPHSDQNAELLANMLLRAEEELKAQLPPGDPSEPSLVGAKRHDAYIATIKRWMKSPSVLTPIAALKRNEQEAVRESHKRTIDIFESITDACYTLDKEWRFTYMNSKAEELLRPVKKNAQDLLGKTIWDEFPDTVGTVVEETYRRVIATQTKAEFELHYTPIGLWLEVRAYPSKEGISVYFHDISERQRAKAELRESEARFRNMSDHAPIMLCVTDSSGACTHLNQRWVDFTGQTAEQGRGRGWLEAVHPDDRLASEELFGALKSVGQTSRAEYRLRARDGTYRWVLCVASPRYSDHGEFLGYIASVLDVQERKEVDVALQKSRDRFDIVKDAAQVGFWFCDLPFDVLVWDNRVKEHFWLPPGAPVTIDTFYEQIHPDDRERTRTTIAASINDKTRYEIEYRTVDKATSAEKWIRAIGRTFYDADGQPIRFDGVTLDITEQRRNQDALRDAKDQALRASRAKDEFLAKLSHELRTPLTPVLIVAESLAEDEQLPMDAREQLKGIVQNVEAEARLIDDLLDLTRIAHGKLTLRKEVCDAHSLLKLVGNVVKEEIRSKQIDLTLELEATHYRLIGDSSRLQQVFWNLLRNAVKFTPNAGRVRIRSSNRAKTGSNGSWFCIEMTDSGIGFPPELADKLFLPFEQGTTAKDPRYSGLGLGLSIAREIVLLHGGSIAAASEGPGRGATFSVELPVAS